MCIRPGSTRLVMKSEISFAVFKQQRGIFFGGGGNVIELESVAGNRVKNEVIRRACILESVQY